MDAARGVNPGRTQLFGFGVGFDVNTTLLDSLTREFVGTSHYVTPGERIDTEVARLYERISSPVLTDVKISIAGGAVTALAPAAVTGIFAGSQTLLTGRYGEAESIVVTVRGNTSAGSETFRYELNLPRRATADPTIAQLWAQQRVADLLTELRLEGARDSLIAEIVEIATQFGIVTPFTSFLAQEPMALFDSDLAREAVADEAQQAASAPASGADAVAQAEASEELREGATALGTNAIRVVGAQSYAQVGDAWVQAGLDPAAEAEVVTVGSDAFAALIAARPELAQAATLGDAIIVAGLDGNVRIVWPDPESIEEVALPPVDATVGAPTSVTPETTTTPTPVAAVTTEGDGGSTGLWIGISVALTALVAAAGFAAQRRMRRS